MLGRHIGAWGHLKWPATGKQGHFKSQLPWVEASEIFLALIWTFLGERLWPSIAEQGGVTSQPGVPWAS